MHNASSNAIAVSALRAVVSNPAIRISIHNMRAGQEA
jgi:hypothetical protein